MLDKRIPKDLAKDCIYTGKVEKKNFGKRLSSKKYRRGELVVVWKQEEEVYFVITGYWRK